MSEVKVFWRKVKPDAEPPRNGSVPIYAKSEAGHNVKIVIPPHTPKLVRTALSFLLPDGMVAFICSRRDSAKAGLSVVNAPLFLTALGATEELKLVLHNGGLETIYLSHGDLIANFVVIAGRMPHWEESP